MPRGQKHDERVRDDVDLKLAARELATAREELRDAHVIVEPRERREAFKAAVARLELATRHIDEVIERREQ